MFILAASLCITIKCLTTTFVLTLIRTSIPLVLSSKHICCEDLGKCHHSAEMSSPQCWKTEVGSHRVSNTNHTHIYRQREKEHVICHLAAVELWNWFQGSQLFNIDGILQENTTICIFSISESSCRAKKYWKYSSKCGGQMKVKTQTRFSSDQHVWKLQPLLLLFTALFSGSTQMTHSKFKIQD